MQLFLNFLVNKKREKENNRENMNSFKQFFTKYLHVLSEKSLSFLLVYIYLHEEYIFFSLLSEKASRKW